MCRAEEQDGFVVTCWSGVFFADYEEACYIICNIFNVGTENFQAVDFSGDLRSDCGGIFLTSGHPCGSCAGSYGDGLCFTEHSGEPVSALGEDFGLRINLFDFFNRAVCKQVVVDGHVYFAADHDVGFDEGIERFSDAAACGVFDWDDAEVAVGLADFFEDSADVGKSFVLDALAEFDHCGGVAEASLRAEIRDSKGAFQDKRTAHEFTPDGDECFVRERAFVCFCNFIENGFFTVGGVDL